MDQKVVEAAVKWLDLDSGLLSDRAEQQDAGGSAQHVEDGHDRQIVLDSGDPLPSAELFIQARFTAGRLRTLHHSQGEFYRWTGTYYLPASEDELKATLYPFLGKAKRRATNGRLAPFKPTKSKVANVLDGLKAVVHLPRATPPTWLGELTAPPPRELLACTNGLLHLPSGELLPHDPRFFALNALDYAYEPDAPPPTPWLVFLDQLWPGDQESVETLQELFGYLLTDDTSQQKIFLLVGPRRGGKGTIARVLTASVGIENVCAPTLASLTQNFGLWPLIGKRLALVSDARLGRRTDQQTLTERLLSISGEDAITVDRKHKEFWTGKLPTRFTILTNELPRMDDTSGALASRFIVLLLTKSWLGKEDPLLTDKLLVHRPGILRWARAGWLRLQQRGHFIQPNSAEAAVQDLHDLGSPVSEFVRERCEIGPQFQVPRDDLYRAWEEWCENHGRTKVTIKATFGRDLRAVLPTLKDCRPTDGGQRVRGYWGLRLRAASE